MCHMDIKGPPCQLYDCFPTIWAFLGPANGHQILRERSIGLDQIQNCSCTDPSQPVVQFNPTFLAHRGHAAADGHRTRAPLNVAADTLRHHLIVRGSPCLAAWDRMMPAPALLDGDPPNTSDWHHPADCAASIKTYLASTFKGSCR